MSITDGMYQLGHAAKRLNRGSDTLNQTLSQIDAVLGQLNVGMEFTLPRPLHEDSSIGSDGKRVISVGFLAYARIKGRFRLVYRTVKILESRRDSAGQGPGDKIPLLDAPRRVRHLAVDQLPDLVGGLSKSVDEVLKQLDRRQSLAENVLTQLEGMLGDARDSGAAFLRIDPNESTASAATMAAPVAAQGIPSPRPKRKTAPGHLTR